MTNKTAHTIITGLINNSTYTSSTTYNILSGDEIAALYHAKDLIHKTELDHARSMIGAGS
jgi:hypothetical protein